MPATDNPCTAYLLRSLSELRSLRDNGAAAAEIPNHSLRATNLRRRASHHAFAARLVEEPGPI
jgi:hypothetical protein